MTARRPHLPALTALRFFAATAVVVFHAQRGALADWPRFLVNVVDNGYQAVPFFFVLSGFILIYVYAPPREQDPLSVTPRAFWAARFARIYPAYALAFLIELPWHVYTTFVSRITSPSSFVVGILTVPTLSQAWISHEVNTSWNPPAWSLCAEALFYLLFPLLFAWSSRLSIKRSLAVSVSLLVVVSLVRCLAPLSAEAVPEPAIGRWERFPPLHLPQFLLGVALGRLFLYGRPAPSLLLRILLAIAVASTISICGFSSLLPAWTRESAVMAPLFGVLIVGTAGTAGWFTRVLSHPLLVLLGEASYSIYILHLPLLAWWLWLQRIGLIPDTPLLSLVLFVGLVIGASLAALRWIERPMRRWLAERLS